MRVTRSAIRGTAGLRRSIGDRQPIDPWHDSLGSWSRHADRHTTSVRHGAGNSSLRDYRPARNSTALER
jgi:hypothetical protein